MKTEMSQLMRPGHSAGSRMSHPCHWACDRDVLLEACPTALCKSGRMLRLSPSCQP